MALVNDVRAKSKRPAHLKKLFDPYLHPRGIKELAAPSHLRVAFAVIHLLDTLEIGAAEDRLLALRSLRGEVLHNDSLSMRRNTARVLLAIMKQLVREQGGARRQLELAHDFFAAVSGRPRVIRRELRRYRLVEMPESWTQVAFDHHVHDASTKGRKSPTHLIMDAWIKGIRELTVVYYNYILPEVAAELTEAADIMGVTVRAGIELSACFRGKYVQFIWQPRGFSGREDFLRFLQEKPVRNLFEEGRGVSLHRARHVTELLASFNAHHLESLNAAYDLELAPLQEQELLRFVGIGQPSVAHLAEFIQHLAVTQVSERMEDLRQRHASGREEERRRVERLIEQVNGLTPTHIADTYLRPGANPELRDPKDPAVDVNAPPLLKLSPAQLIERLGGVHSGFRLTLNPSDLTRADVLELLYDGGGAITHIEVFNLKDHRLGKSNAQVGRIRRTLNSGSPTACKRLVQEILEEVESGDEPDRRERAAKLHEMLRDISRLVRLYRDSPLRSRIGSDSISRAGEFFGMGLVALDSLPPRLRRGVAGAGREVVPVRAAAAWRTTWAPRHSSWAWLGSLYAVLRALPLPRPLGYAGHDAYVLDDTVTRVHDRGNLATLGGLAPCDNGLRLTPEPPRLRGGWSYLSTRWRNTLKVCIGFLPAFLTFALTKDWWVLTYLGAPIWFGITGLRNVLQSVLAGRGLLPSPLLRWNDYVSWERVADSLLFTGFSVPLLDWLVKTVLLHQGLGITAGTAPVVLYSLLALANGVYLATHNTLRGLPRGAVVGNLFRSVLSIPIAIALDVAVGALLGAAGMPLVRINAMLQAWAAVLGKAASDTVAAVIEGTADRAANVRLRAADYKAKLAQVLDVHGGLEMLFPEANVLEMLRSPKQLIRAVEQEARQLEIRLVINALDLMYFWMYQPRARSVLRQRLLVIPAEERRVILTSQAVLERQRVITALFLDHLVGKSFARALAFYLQRSSGYLADMRRLAAWLDARESGRRPPSTTAVRPLLGREVGHG